MYSSLISRRKLEDNRDYFISLVFHVYSYKTEYILLHSMGYGLIFRSEERRRKEVAVQPCTLAPV